MAFVLSEEQTMLQDMAAQFFSEQAPVANLRKLRDDEDALGYDKDIWSQIVELGFAGILIPENYGGTGFGPLGMGIIFEQAGRTLAASPLFSTSCLGASLILELGSEKQKEALLPKIAGGELLLALAHEETSHHNPSHIATTAHRDGDAFVLTGEKRMVLDGHIADKLIVVARSSGATHEKEGISLFLVDANAPGVTVTRTSMVDSRNSAIVSLDNVRVSADHLLGDVGAGFVSLEKTLDLGRVMLAAEMLGGIETIFETTLEYLKERKQFGAIIGSFQALKHRAATMFCELQISQTVVQDALSALEDNRNDIGQVASLTKARLCESSRLITNEGLQMHGGIGMTDAVDIGLFMKRARVQSQIMGDVNFHSDRYASLGNY